MTGNSHWTPGSDDISIERFGGGKCYVLAPTRQGRLTVEVEAGRAVDLIMDVVRLSNNAKKFQEFPGQLTLTAGIGRVTTGSPAGSYWAYALFACDRQNVAFDLSISIGPGRNLVADVSAMMSIAQRRYAMLAKCDLGPPDKELIPPGA